MWRFTETPYKLRDNRPAAGRAGASGAAEAVIARHDFATVDLIRIDIPQEHRLAIFPLHVELLIKIAIVNFAAPADADRVTAHQTFDCGWIKRINEQLHVFVKLVVVPQIRGEARDRQI